MYRCNIDVKSTSIQHAVSVGLSPKICVPKKTKDIYVIASNMIINENEAKAMIEHISCDIKCKFNRTT